MLLDSHSEFQVANTLTGIQNTLNNLQTMVQNGFDRLEARFEDMKIVQANHLQLQSNTAYLSRQKQVSLVHPVGMLTTPFRLVEMERQRLMRCDLLILRNSIHTMLEMSHHLVQHLVLPSIPML